MRWMQTIANSAREFWRVFQAGYFKRNCVFYSLLAKQTYCYDRADAPRFQQHLCIQPLKLINTGNHKVVEFFQKGFARSPPLFCASHYANEVDKYWNPFTVFFFLLLFVLPTLSQMFVNEILIYYFAYQLLMKNKLKFI